MAHNVINRHSRGDRTLTPDADGYYSIELTADVGSHTDDPTLVPIPEKDAYLVQRLYGPSQAVQEGDYPTPVFDVVSEPTAEDEYLRGSELPVLPPWGMNKGGPGSPRWHVRRLSCSGPRPSCSPSPVFFQGSS